MPANPRVDNLTSTNRAQVGLGVDAAPHHRGTVSVVSLRRLPRPILALLLFVLALAAIVPLIGANGPNNANAAQCQKGGWEVLATTADPFDGFANQGECVSAAAKGATLTGLLSTVITATRQPSGFTFMGRYLCSLQYSVANPNPAYTAYDVTVTLREGTTYSLPTDNLVYGDSTDYAIASAYAVAQPGDIAVPVLIEDDCTT